MTIVYIPVRRRAVRKKQETEELEETIPSPLVGRVPAEEWQEIIARINHHIKRRQASFLVKALTITLLGNLLRKIFLARIDKNIALYLEKKNLALQSSGVYIHHPKERNYSGMDVSIYTYIED